jgi:hypothetical protein
MQGGDARKKINGEHKKKRGNAEGDRAELYQGGLGVNELIAEQDDGKKERSFLAEECGEKA